SSSLSTSPQRYDVVLDVANLFNYDPAQGDLLLDVTIRNAPTAGFLATPQPGQATTTTRIFSFNADDTSGVVGFIPTDSRPYGLITRFDMLTPPNEDWYSFNVPAANTGLRIQTSTPGDGPGQFVNVLDPHVQLYDPSGALVA